MDNKRPRKEWTWEFERTGVDGIHGDRARESTTNQHISWALPKAAINELSGDSPKMFTSSRQILVNKSSLYVSWLDLRLAISLFVYFFLRQTKAHSWKGNVMVHLHCIKPENFVGKMNGKSNTFIHPVLFFGNQNFKN